MLKPQKEIPCLAGMTKLKAFLSAYYWSPFSHNWHIIQPKELFAYYQHSCG
jgi:hypothetical protein